MEKERLSRPKSLLRVLKGVAVSLGFFGQGLLGVLLPRVERLRVAIEDMSGDSIERHSLARRKALARNAALWRGRFEEGPFPWIREINPSFLLFYSATVALPEPVGAHHLRFFLKPQTQ